MRKKILLSVIIVLLWTEVAWATNVGGPSYNLGANTPSLGVNLGYFQREVEMEDGREEIYNSKMIFAKANYGILNWIDVYGVIGYADIFDFEIRENEEEFSGNMQIAYTLGGRLKLFGSTETGPVLSTSLQYSFLSSEDGEEEVEYEEYQAAITFSNRLGNFIPYGGAKFNYIDFSEAKDTILGFDGLFMGFDYFVSGNTFFHSELSNFNENGVYMGVGFLF